ncbi:MAG: glycosyltransferase family 2 protein [Coriobacteriales bacterium]|nr:glycosyltransferase family 2 protein [Coriobacteriales bacterium]
MAGKLPKFFSHVKNYGLRKALQTAKSRLRSQPTVSLKELIGTEEAELEAERAQVFDPMPLISIVVPLYNTNEEHLKEMLDSVQQQTYGAWELMLIDASDENHAGVGSLCKERARDNERIVYHPIPQNLGIADNTNIGLAAATGAYIALLDHDDLLHPSALFEFVQEIDTTGPDLLYSDELIFYGSLEKEYTPHFKPDFSPDLLRSYNYICHFLVFSRGLYETCGGMRSECSGSQDYDLTLRLSEQAATIAHIPKLLYFWRRHAESYSTDLQQRTRCIIAAKTALEDQLERLGLQGEVLDANLATYYRISYAIQGSPLVSIIIPNKDHVEDLETCLQSILKTSSYTHYEILIIENNSEDSETFRYYEQLTDPRIKLLTYTEEFNFAALNNFAAEHANGEYLLFLNNDTEVINPAWLEEMLMFAQRGDVGAVGAKLYYPDNTIQHAGVILGIAGGAGHSHKGKKRNDLGYFNRAQLVQNISAVTGACLMVGKNTFFEVEGFTEEFTIAYNDVDLCLKLRERGYLNVYTPYAELYHFESKSRGYEDTPEKIARLRSEVVRLRTRWGEVFENGDPYYNPNLTLEREDFSLS